MEGIMECVSPILSFLCTPVIEQLQALAMLEENADKLVEKMDRLRVMKTDLERRLDARESNRIIRADLVGNWLKSVDSLVQKVNQFDQLFAGRRISCLPICPPDACWSNYLIGRRLVSLLEEVSNLGQGGPFLDNELVIEAPHRVVEEVPCPVTVGGNETISKIRECIDDDEVRMVGIFGMGGVGKTTLLKKINNELKTNGTDDFDIVIWVNISKDLNIPKIQRQICKRVGLPYSDGQTDELAKDIFDFLSDKRFLLLLDDLWEKLDFEKIGIPSPHSEFRQGRKWKIAFTARSEEVCNLMGVKKGKVKVGLLNKQDSWELFCDQLDDASVLDDQSISPLARAIVDACGCLPLALVALGKAMASASRLFQWRKAKKELEESASRFEGMEHVVSQLKFSFDSLKNDAMRSCLLYCSLLPGSFNNYEEDLVELFIGEGFLEENNDRESWDDDIYSARDKGFAIINSLKAAGLLDGSLDWQGKEIVRMHDCVRDMALWLTNGKLDASNIFLVCPASTTKLPGQFVATCRQAKRIFLMHDMLEELLNQMPDCPNLLTFLVGGTYKSGPRCVPTDFFHFMPALRVLDLSRTRIEELPTSIGLLIGLQHLNLSTTGIKELPKELGNLVRLRQLNLQDTSALSSFPVKAISKLFRLQMLDMSRSSYSWSKERWGNMRRAFKGQIKVTDLEILRGLDDLRLSISDLDALQMLVDSRTLPRSTAHLYITKLSGLTEGILFRTFEIMVQLQFLEIRDIDLVELAFMSGHLQKLGDLKLCGLSVTRITGIPLQSLCRLEVNGCKNLIDLTWVAQLSCLERLEIISCELLEEVVAPREVEEESNMIGSGGANITSNDASFPKLKFLVLSSLPLLRNISSHPLLFPSLKKLYVRECPNLSRLPFSLDNAKTIKEIKCEKEWRDQLHWDMESVRLAFLPMFKKQKGLKKTFQPT